ncbi:MAG: glycosyltransferase family 2 protein [Cellvibrionaceae bacterium]
MSNSAANSSVSVVIPFFQRERGLLKRSVNSILDQEGVSNIQIIVVDDDSPISAGDELSELIATTDSITVIEQENAGPGAARNAALDHITSDCTYIAFMDSDDWWESGFLKTAVEALDQGHDLFFCDTQRQSIEGTRFEWNKQEGLNLTPKGHQLLDAALETYRFDGDFFDYAIVRSNIISTSALVYRRSSKPELRFNTQLFNGQDRLFKLSLSQSITRVAFCAKTLVSEGLGVNIFDSAGWGTSKSLTLLTNYIRLAKCILATLTLTKAQRVHVNNQLQESRYSMVANLMHLIKSKQPIEWTRIWTTIKIDPLFAVFFLPNVMRLLVAKRSASPQET